MAVPQFAPNPAQPQPGVVSDGQGHYWYYDAQGQPWYWNGAVWVAPTPPDQSAANVPYGQAPPGGSTPDPSGGKGPPNADPQTGVITVPAWQTQQSWWGTLFPKDTLQRTAYDLDPSFAWASATNQLGGNSWAPRYDWMARQQGRYHTLYGDENTRAAGTPQGNMTFADWIEANASRFQHDFDLMPASQRGVVNPWMPAGRQT